MFAKLDAIVFKAALALFIFQMLLGGLVYQSLVLKLIIFLALILSSVFLIAKEGLFWVELINSRWIFFAALSYFVARYFSNSEMQMFDVALWTYVFVFCVASIAARNLIINNAVVLVPIVGALIVFICAYAFQVPSYNLERFRYCGLNGPCADPTVAAVMYTCTATAAALFMLERTKICYFLLGTALIVGFALESRTATLYIFLCLLLGAAKKNIKTKAIYFTFGAFFSVLAFELVYTIRHWLLTEDVFKYKSLVNSMLILQQRFIPSNVAVEEVTHPAGRIKIYGDFFENCLLNVSSILHGCRLVVTANPHNEFARMYANGGALLLGGFIFALVFCVYRAKNALARVFLVASMAPLFFYGFNYYIFYPPFLLSLLAPIRMRSDHD